MAQPANRRLVTESALTEAVGGLVTEAELAASLADFEPGASLPEGGTAGQVLTKTTTGEAWQAAPSGLPSGGSTGHVVVKTAAGSAWAPVPKELPEGGSAGQLLARTAEGITWTAPPSEIPAGGSTGQALMRTATGVGWGTPQAAGASWDADKLAIARGFHEVYSNTEPAQPSYTASNGKVYPVVWVRPVIVPVPAVPEEPFWYRDRSSFEVPDLIGVDYRVTAVVKDGTTTTVNYLVQPEGLFDLATITEASLPYTVKVEALADAGYELPVAYSWTYDFPDPDDIAIITSDTFSVDGLLSSKNTDALLGGVPMPMVEPSGSSVGGLLAPTAVWRINASPSVNFEVELDATMFTDETVTGDPGFGIEIGINKTTEGAVQFHNTGARVRVQRGDAGLTRVHDAGGQLHYGSVGTTINGHWKLAVVENTVTLTAPGASPRTWTLTQAVVGSKFRGSHVAVSADKKVRLDNVVVKQIGF